MKWNGTHFKEQVINLQKVLKFVSEGSVASKYTGIKLEQYGDYSIFMHQNSFATKSLTVIILCLIHLVYFCV